MRFPRVAGFTAVRGCGVAILTILLGLSEACYVAMLRLDAVNGLRPVLTFLLLIAVLFAFMQAQYG